MLNHDQISLCQDGLALLARPVLPLARLAGMLFLTGPFQSMAEVVGELPEDMETSGIRYPQPSQILSPFLPDLAPYERLKSPQAPQRLILSATGEGLEVLAAIDVWVAQNILSRELETINSLLCGPCNCRLCCVGPEEAMQQHFFEIPLQADELPNFKLNTIDSSESRALTADSEPALEVDGRPFYDHDHARLIHWRHGWGMILPTGCSCPQLDQTSGGCTIYPVRPDVCRRPQIFAYALERQVELDIEVEERLLPAFCAKQAILAIWDCPYVQQFQDEIGRYAQLCEMEPVFKKNKA